MPPIISHRFAPRDVTRRVHNKYSCIRSASLHVVLTGSWSRYRLRARAVPCCRPCCRPERRYYQAHSTGNAHVHHYTRPRMRSSLRSTPFLMRFRIRNVIIITGDWTAAQCERSARSYRRAHSCTHRRQSGVVQ